MSEINKDILQRGDIELLVNRFYEKVKSDELLQPIFSHVDWQSHLPVMYNFWSSTLLGDQTYQGNPLVKHMKLPIDHKHFKRWLELFSETVTENFKGEKAEEAKIRAQSIAGIFQYKMKLKS